MSRPVQVGQNQIEGIRRGKIQQKQRERLIKTPRFKTKR